MDKNLVIIHGGGPTAVINASLSGAIREAQASPDVGRIYAAIADRVKKTCDAFIVIGVGGLNNAARSVIEVLVEDGEEMFKALGK